MINYTCSIRYYLLVVLYSRELLRTDILMLRQIGDFPVPIDKIATYLAISLLSIDTFDAFYKDGICLGNNFQLTYFVPKQA